MADLEASSHKDTSDQPTPIIYLIRHAEKPPKGPDGDDVNGLSAQGIERAQALRKVFGVDSSYNIGHIIAEHPKKDGSRARPYHTVMPLATDLAPLGVRFDFSVDRDDAKGAAKAAKAYEGPGNVLVCWEHGVLGEIAEKMGVKDDGRGNEKIKYPDDRFDIIWAAEKPYKKIESWTSEGVEGLDDGLPTP